MLKLFPRVIVTKSKLLRVKMADFEIGAMKSMFKPPTASEDDANSGPSPTIERLDHLVLTVADLDRTVEFYSKALGMTPEKFGAGRLALKFGQQKINLHQSGKEFQPHAKRPTPGSADLCFISQNPLLNWIDHLTQHNVEIIEGPVARTGAIGPMKSIYISDPDSNLIEISNYDEK